MDKIIELKEFIEKLKEESISSYCECVKENGDEALVCNIYSAAVMVYGIVIRKIEELKL